MIPGWNLAASRLAISGQTGSETADHDIDNVAIAALAGADDTKPLTLDSVTTGAVAAAGGVYRFGFDVT